MTLRDLPRAEWDRLEGLDMGLIAPALPPDSHILIVEDDGAIVGTWAVIRYVHVEGLWIAPEHRKRSRVGAHLLAGMRTVANAWDTQAVLTACSSDEVRRLLDRIGGVQLPGDHFVFPVERR